MLTSQTVDGNAPAGMRALEVDVGVGSAGRVQMYDESKD